MLDEPEGTVTLEGTVTALLLLARLTINPPVPAAALSVTVHASVDAPVNEELVQLSPCRVAELELVDEGFSCSAKVADVPFALAVSVAVCASLTAAMAAVKLAVFAPALTVTDDGTVAALLLLESDAASPPVPAAADSVTVHVSVPAPLRVDFEQLSALSVGELVLVEGFSCKLNVNDVPPAVAVNVAVCAEVTAVTVAVKLALVAPEATVTLVGAVTELLLLVRLTAVPAEGADPFNVTVQESVPAAVNELVVQLIELSAGPLVLPVLGGVSCRVYVCVTPPAVAVTMAVCAEVTAATVAVKLALVDPDATVTLLGTVTALLLLARPTEIPPLGAAPLNVTVHASVPAPVMDAFAQLTALNVLLAVLAEVPVPLSEMLVELLFVASLVTDIWPVTSPEVVGVKLMLKV